MNQMQIQVDLDPFLKLQNEWNALPSTIARYIAAALRDIGKYDIETLKANPGGLRVRSKGLLGSFKSKATDDKRADDLDKLFLSEYSGWKGASIQQTGGTITARNRFMTVLLPAGRGPSGRRRYTQKQMRQMIADGKLRMFKTKGGEMLIVRDVGGLTKAGKGRKNSRVELIAVLKNKVVIKKHLNFFENFDRNDSVHEQLLAQQLEAALEEVAGR